MNRQAKSGRNRKIITFAWITALALLTVFLIYRELTAVLYILATLGVTALLIVVALADLSKHETFSPKSPQADDAAALGGGISASNRAGRR
jgi:hypothetical protein